MELYQNWDGATSTWESYYQTIYTYDVQGNLISTLSQQWNNLTSAWENAYQSTTTYDANGMITGYSYLYSYNGTWVSGDKYTYTLTLNGITLDANGEPITAGTAVMSEEHYTWDGTDWVLTNGRRYYMSCKDVVGLAENTIFSDVIMYPNPASTEVKIKGLPQASVINVLDITGKLLLTQKASDENVVIETSTLSAGMYIVQIQSGNATANKKLMISK